MPSGAEPSDERFITPPHTVRPSEHGPIPLEPDTPADHAPPKVRCPACNVGVSADAPVCGHCGFDRRKGYRPGTGVGADAHSGGVLVCPSCGYDLTGLTSPRCPECGERSTLSARDAARQRAARVAWREELLVPGIMFAAGHAVALGVMVAQHWAGPAAAGAGLSPVARAAVLYAVFFPIDLATGIMAYVIIGIMWMGFNAPMGLIALRLAGVYAVVNALTVLNRALTPGLLDILVYALVLLVYAAMLGKFLEMEMQETYALAVLSFMLKFALLVSVMSYI